MSNNGMSYSLGSGTFYSLVHCSRRHLVLTPHTSSIQWLAVSASGKLYREEGVEDKSDLH